MQTIRDYKSRNSVVALLFWFFFLNRALKKNVLTGPTGYCRTAQVAVFGVSVNSMTPKTVTALGNVSILDSTQRVNFKKKRSFKHSFCFQGEKRLTLQRKSNCPNSGWVKMTESYSVMQAGLQVAGTLQVVQGASHAIVRSQLKDTRHQQLFWAKCTSNHLLISFL